MHLAAFRVHGQCLDAAARFDDGLLQERALAVGKDLVLLPERQPRRADHHPCRSPHRLIGPEQQSDFVLQRYLPGIDLQRRAIGPGVGHRRPQVDIADFEQGRSFGDLHRQGRHPVHLGGGQAGGAGKAPGPIHHDAHAKALAFILRERFDHAVFDGDVLGAPVHDADVRIGGALHLRQIQGSVGQIFQNFPPLVHGAAGRQKSSRQMCSASRANSACRCWIASGGHSSRVATSRLRVYWLSR